MKNDAWVLQEVLATRPGALDALDVPAPRRAPLSAATVMMVDDEPLMTDLIQAHLEEQGYARFVATNDPREALPLLRSHQPGVLLLDLMMPAVSGFDILAQIRADEHLRYTPVIVLTAANGPDSKLRALELGATDFLSKPVDPSELLLRVRNTLAFKEYHDHTLNFDAVTGLPNQRLFERRLDAALAQAEGGVVGLLNVTVAECRQIRDTLGNSAADHLLKTIADRLSRTLRSGDTPSYMPNDRASSVLRLDSDEFAVLLAGLRNAEEAESVAKRILQVLAAPVLIGDHEVVPSTSLGIAIAPTDGNTAEALIKGADQARSQAQSNGGNRYEFFSSELNARSFERLTLGAQLRRAVQRDELRLHYQPKVDVATNRVIGAEALVRWQHPDHGLMAPDRFIPLAEELALIASIGDWVITQACSDCARWTREGRGALRVAVNVSKPQFEGGHLCRVLRAALRDTGLEPWQLVVELTESMLMGDAQATMALMHEIKSLGVSLSIDDFGTGYSSLSYLKRFPVDELKIDRSFLTDLPGRVQDLAIVGTVISLGHSLGMTVVAEGVEGADQLAALRGLGCDTYQGFLFSRPVPEARLLELLLSS